MGKRSYEAERHTVQLLLRQVRIEAGLRQVDVARKLGRHPTFVSHCELGKHRLDVSELKHFCDIVGMSLLDFTARYEAALDGKGLPAEGEMRRRGDWPKRRRR